MCVCVCVCLCVCVCVCVCAQHDLCASVYVKKGKKEKEAPRSLGLFRELTLTLKDIEKTSSVGDQLRDPKLPPYGSLYRGIATDH